MLIKIATRHFYISYHRPEKAYIPNNS